MTCPLPKLQFLSSDVDGFLRESFKNQEVNWFDVLLKCLGTPPLYTTVRVNTLKVSVKDAKTELKAILDKQCQEKDWPSFIVNTHSDISDILVIPGTGPERCIPVDKEIIVDVHCGTAVLRGADIFAPGIIGAHTGIRKNDTVSIYVDLETKCRKGFAKPYLGNKLFIGNGVAVMSRNDVFCDGLDVSGVAVKMTSPLYKCPSLSNILTGLVFPQNLPSVIVGHILGPLPGQTVLDMCASPGKYENLLNVYRVDRMHIALI
ncbi:putative methyltransferase NSUN6 [Exaiptasia diaphana]|nr:putative methyltransferase NSUN6 [Exaiptasia diaphana]